MSGTKRKANHAFASAICKARQEYGLTQEETAEIIGVSSRWYQKIEAGTGKPNLQHTLHLMALFDLDPKILAKETGLTLPKRSGKSRSEPVLI